MNKPSLPIEVDAKTGVWQTDGLPMLYVPRHFFVNNHDAIERIIGREEYEKILGQAGYKSAYQWCTHEARQHGLKGMDVFRHYLQRLSLRGWGRFSFVAGRDNHHNPPLVIRLDYSAFVLHARKFPEPGKKSSEGKTLCYMFAGWFAGAADWVAEQDDKPDDFRAFQCRETHCAFGGAFGGAFEGASGSACEDTVSPEDAAPEKDFCLYEIGHT